MSDFKVTVIPQKGYYIAQIAEKITNYLKKEGIDLKGKTVLLKPSFVLPVPDLRLRLAVDTHNSVTVGVARALASRGASKIIIAEHRTIGPSRYAFYTMGIKKAIKKAKVRNVKYAYLDEKKRIDVPVKDPFIENHIVKYPKMLLDGTVDYFISLPKLKANIFSGITLSVKNNFGLISKKERLAHHGLDLHANLADLELIRQPDLIITDAIVSGEGQGPEQPDPVHTEMLIVSNNCLAVDTVSCYLMGQDPRNVEHLKILHDRGIGPLDMANIQVENKEYLESKKKVFKMPDSTLEMTPWMKAWTGKIKACQGGCLGMVKGILDTYGMVNGWYSLGRLNILLGDGIEITQEELEKLDKKRTIVYGDCVKEYKKYGTFFKGCPPDYTKSLIKIWLRGPLGMNPHLKLKYLSPFKFGRAWGMYLLQRMFRF